MLLRLQVLMAFLLAFAPQTAFACSHQVASNGGMLLGVAFVLVLLVGSTARPIAQVLKRGTGLVAALFPIAGLMALGLALLNIDGVFENVARFAHTLAKPEIHARENEFWSKTNCGVPSSAPVDVFKALLFAAFWLMMFRLLVWKNEKYRKLIQRAASFRLGIGAVLVLWAGVHFFLWFTDDARGMKTSDVQGFTIIAPKDVPKEAPKK